MRMLTGGRFIEQIIKEWKNRIEQENLKIRFENENREEEHFSIHGDKKLTKEQIQALDQFWGRYSFAYPEINYQEFEAYMNRSGKFDVRNLPAVIKGKFVAPYLQNRTYYWPCQNKALLERIFPGIKQPQTIIRRMNGYYYDNKYKRITIDIAVERCLKYISGGGKPLIFKPNASGGGRGIQLLKQANPDLLRSVFASLGNTFIVQEVLLQHAELEKLNPLSVNTCRVSSIIWKNKVEILGGVLRVGNGEKAVDNWSSGGIIVGVNPDGTLYSSGLDKQCRVYNCSCEGIPFDGFVIPNYRDILETVRLAHMQIPYIKLASWDIAVDRDGIPNLIEVNFAGDRHVHQFTTGPMLGELTKEILDEAILKNYYKKHSTLHFDYREYYDHVEIEKYIGESKVVSIPSEKWGKPVTVIRGGAFKANGFVEKVNLSKNIKRINEKAFFGCTQLKTINLGSGIVIHPTAFIGCKLSTTK